jgi:hypothetical protein
VCWCVKHDRRRRARKIDPAPRLILAIVKEGEAGRKVADLCRANGITEQTYYRWKANYGGMELSEMQGAIALAAPFWFASGWSAIARHVMDPLLAMRSVMAVLSFGCRRWRRP